MSLVYKMAQTYRLIPWEGEHIPLRFVRCKTASGYEAITIAPRQAWETRSRLLEPESSLTLLTASTGLRISECLGLQSATLISPHR